MAERGSEVKIKLPPGGPDIDEAKMLRFGGGDYHQNELFVLGEFALKPQDSKKQRNRRMLAPLVKIDARSQAELTQEPACLITKSSPKLPATNVEFGDLGKREFALSGAVHVLLGLVVLFVTFVADHAFLETQVTPVELVFGVEEELKDIPEAPKEVAKEAQVPEAEKPREILPQLPKQVAINAEEAPKDAVPPPQVLTPSPTKPAVVQGPTPPPGVKVMDPKDVLKRMEREQRKAGDKDVKGKNVASKDKNQKAPDVKFDLPPPPIPQSIPGAPTGLGPAGSVEGKVNANVKDAYTVAASNHIRRNWKLPETSNFSANLAATVLFDIDTFGKIVGKVTVVESSGNAEYDREALEAATAAAPFPDLPAELAPRMTLRIRLPAPDKKK